MKSPNALCKFFVFSLICSTFLVSSAMAVVQFEIEGVTAQSQGDRAGVYILLGDLTSDVDIFSIQFKLIYDPAKLSVITREENAEADGLDNNNDGTIDESGETRIVPDLMPTEATTEWLIEANDVGGELRVAMANALRLDENELAVANNRIVCIPFSPAGLASTECTDLQLMPLDGILINEDPLAEATIVAPSATFDANDGPSDDVCLDDDGGVEDWISTLTATSDDTAIAPQTLTFGVDALATDGFDSNIDVAAPPEPPEPVLLDLFFPLNDVNTPLITRLATDIRGDADAITWPFKLRADQNGGTLSWDVSAIPDKFTSCILRTPSGAEIDMRIETEFIFAPGDQMFEIIAGAKFTCVIPLAAGWNMISIPGTPCNTDPTPFLASGSQVLSLFRWDAVGFSYVAVTELACGEGYWILTIDPNGTTVEIDIIPKSTYTTSLPAGWSMIGSVSGDADFSDPQDAPDGAFIPPAFGWDPTGFTYVAATVLESKKGYWVLTLQPADLTITATQSAAPAIRPIRQLPTLAKNSVPAFRFPIHVETPGRTQTLVLGGDKTSKPVLEHFDRAQPPVPPIEGIPDAHFEGAAYRLQQSVQPLTEGATWSIKVVSDTPSKLHWRKEVLPKEFSLIADTPSGEIALNTTDFLNLPAGEQSVTIRLTHRIRVPTESKLLSNFPNPFNPETWLPYQLSEGGEVTLTIYDVNGAKVRTLPLGFKQAGHYLNREKAAYWNGRNENGEQVASGVYFYSLQAGQFSAMRKMVILK